MPIILSILGTQGILGTKEQSVTSLSRDFPFPGFFHSFVFPKKNRYQKSLKIGTQKFGIEKMSGNRSWKREAGEI